MAKNEITVVRLDKKSIDAITNLTKAVKAQTEIIKKNQRPYTVTPGVHMAGIPPYFATGGYTGQDPTRAYLVEGDHIDSTHAVTVDEARHALRQGSN